MDDRVQTAVARLLVDTLTEQTWAAFDRPAEVAFPSDAMAERALGIFRVVNPVSELRVFGESEPIDVALGVLHNIASGSALLANHWEQSELARLVLPQRRFIEHIIYEQKVDEWVREFGFELSSPADVGGDAYEATPHKGTPARADVERIVVNFSSIAKAYTDLLAAHGRPDVLARIRTPRLRVLACEILARATEGTAWVRGNLNPERVIVGAAMLHMGAGCFIIAWGASREDDYFPSVDYLWKMINTRDTREWLTRHGAVLPKWLD